MTIESRASLLSRLLWTLQPQLTDEVEVLVHNTELTPVGTKTDELHTAATGQFAAQIGDDDLVSSDYVSSILRELNAGADFVGFSVLHTINGAYGAEYPHDPTRGRTVPGAKIRGMSTLMAIPTEVRRAHPFGNGYHDDFTWAAAIERDWKPQKPAYVDRALYHYDYWPAHSLPTVPENGGTNRPGQRFVDLWPFDREKFTWVSS